MNLTSSRPPLDMNRLEASDRLTFILGLTIPIGFMCVCFWVCCIGSARCLCECMVMCWSSTRKCLTHTTRDVTVWDMMGSPGGGLCVLVMDTCVHGDV